MQLKFWLLPILSGIFIGTSYIPFPPWASLFCFVPLWLFWLQQTRLKNIIISGLLTAFIFTLIGFNWVSYLLHEFAYLPWTVAIIGCLLFALVAHLFVVIAGILWFIGRQKFQWSPRLSLIMMALITTLSEFYSWTLFDWNFGYSWFGSGLPVYHWAEFIGFSGLSAVTLLFNLPLCIAWQNRQQNYGKILLGVFLSLFLVANLTGIALKARLPKPDAELSVLIVQANIGNEMKMAAELGKDFRDDILQRYQNLTLKGINQYANAKIDFILWPETAFPALLGKEFLHYPQAQRLKQFLNNQQLPLITGAYSIDKSSRLLTNSLFVLNKDGETQTPHYSKSMLLAFGEYIPGEETFPQIRDWLPATGHFARGTGASNLLKLNDFKMGAQICYESLFPKFSRSLANLGAQFIVNVTNDSWYGTWQEPYQHLYMTLGRGIEFRRPVIRATNTGISTVVLANGDVQQQSPLASEWTGLYKIPYLKKPPETFYQQWFWLVPSLLWLMLVIGIAWGVKQRNFRPPT